ncbi:MAG: hypothetical protein ACFFD4_26085 [Candidatus Odinarchaeota archaeon]
MNGNEIAENKAITTASVSKSLKEANSRIDDLLRNTARSNKVQLELISPKLGYARGYAPALKMRVYITYSPVNGIQVWYDHEGECEMCEELNGCRQALILEFRERNLEVPPETMRPADASALLFKKIEGMLE